MTLSSPIWVKLVFYFEKFAKKWLRKDVSEQAFEIFLANALRPIDALHLDK